MLDVVWRYSSIVNFIKKANLQEKKIVEVGGTGEGLGWYLPDYQIIDCDIDFVKKILPNTKPLKASADKIPLSDNFLEIVISVDTLEHLPTRKKQAKMIKEMLRVARTFVVLAVPTGQKSLEAVKKFGEMFYQKHPGQKYPYLEEHLKFGHPQEKEILRMIRESHYSTRVRTEKNTNNRLWLIYQKIFLNFPQLYHFFRYRRFWYFFFRPLLPLLNRGETLRTIFYIKKIRL